MLHLQSACGKLLHAINKTGSSDYEVLVEIGSSDYEK